MQYIPTHCDVCPRSGLTRASDITNGVASCTQCGGPARVVPGESYAEQDIPLFENLAAALLDAGITPGQAALLSTELEARELLPPGRCIQQLMQTLPSLGVLDVLIPNDASSRRKAEGMLATVLGMMGRSRAHSSVVPAPGYRAAKANGQ